MSSILNMLNSVEDDGLNLVILVPLFVVVVAAVTLLLKFSLQKTEVTKKTQNSVKKQQKLHTANNKQKEEKLNNEKKEKPSKEKKLSSNLNKSLNTQSGNEDAKSNRKQHSTVDEKASKKNGTQTKKHQINNANIKHNSSFNRNNQTTNKKQTVDIFINKEQEGEWQMVTTKKQKSKQEEKVEIVNTPTNASKKSQKSHEKANKQPVNKIKKDKVTEESDNPTKFDNSVVTTHEEIQTVNSYIKESITKHNENTFPAALEEAKVDSGANNTKNTSENSNDVKTLPAQEATSIANVAFDELGDDGWTDTKPQKKNRKRALRE